jgi:hypothetical protein
VAAATRQATAATAAPRNRFLMFDS